ncbi:MAG: acyl-ACP--UDP-N-acetylglucosamine O-acyltransferase [Opitutaceae bacterium]|nr:acyl-ACP--UDP-N-acetylglucosamine O-acyltransferase [Cytophagales bacterium]
MQYHPLTNVHPDAKIGEGTIIEPFATIHKDVIIGENCWIGPNVVLFDGTRIANNVKIFPGASISAVPQDLKFDGETTTVEIGDNTTIRECVTISRGTKDKFKTVIGKDCLIMAYVHVAHDCNVGDKVILVNNVQLAGHVEVGYHAILGGASAVLQFTKIGAHVMLAGGSMVRKDIPPYVLAGEYPVSYMGLNLVGLRRRGFTHDQIGDIQETYRQIYLRGSNISEAVKTLEAEGNLSAERQFIIDFIKSSPKGVIKGPEKSSVNTED